MNSNEIAPSSSNFFSGLVKDDGVQRAAAGVVVAVVVAVAKGLIFGAKG